MVVEVGLIRGRGVVELVVVVDGARLAMWVGILGYGLSWSVVSLLWFGVGVGQLVSDRDVGANSFL